MPAAQLVGEVIERIVNPLIKLDPGTYQRLAVLQGKQLRVNLAELPFAVVLAFAEDISVLTLAKSEHGEYDCEVQLTVDVLSQLKDSSQIPQLIQQKKLQLQGDITVAQDVSLLINKLEIDWEEQLSSYVGDIAAHQLFQIGRTLKQKADDVLTDMTRMLSEGAVEEKKIAAPAIAVSHYCNQVTELRSDVARLEARLTRISDSA